MQQDICERLDEASQGISDDDSIHVGSDAAASDVEGWESLAQIELVSAIEREFDMRFHKREVAGMKNVGETVGVVEERALVQARGRA